jgi:hypothetical protein
MLCKEDHTLAHILTLLLFTVTHVFPELLAKGLEILSEGGLRALLHVAHAALSSTACDEVMSRGEPVNRCSSLPSQSSRGQF